AGRAEPDEVRDDPGQFAGDDTQNFASLGHIDSEQAFSAERERDVVADRVQVVFAVGPADDLIVLAVLADLLEAAMQIADVWNAPHDRLSIELQNEAKNAVRRRMLRAEVDEHVLAF